MNDVAGPPQHDGLWADVRAGFSVFLIALPLSLGIALASGFPWVAGVVTAICGGVVCSLFGTAPLTIKGPAAGLIVVALGCVTELGGGDAHQGYVLTLGVLGVAGVLQILLAALKLGSLMQYVPPSPVHGMLAAIGVIIATKQTYSMLGVAPHAQSPLTLLAELPPHVVNANPDIALIGVVTLVTLIVTQRFRRTRFPRLAPSILGVLVAGALGAYLDLGHEHTFVWLGHAYSVGPRALLTVPVNVLLDLGRPDFSAVLTGAGVKYVIMFVLVGSLESLSTTRTIEQIDPLKRREDHNRDLLAVGVANTLAAFLGGLPMISEIARSSSNVSGGAGSQRAGLAQAGFLLLALFLAAPVLRFVPLASLAALLVFTGVRLAAPWQLPHLLELGADQVAVFLVAAGVTLATNLLLGVGVGIATEALALLIFFRVSLLDLFRAKVAISKTSDELFVIEPVGTLTFLNVHFLRRVLLSVPPNARAIIDLSATSLVDHASMTFLRGWNGQRAPHEPQVVLDKTAELQPIAKSEIGLHFRSMAHR